MLFLALCFFGAQGGETGLASLSQDSGCMFAIGFCCFEDFLLGFFIVQYI